MVEKKVWFNVYDWYIHTMNEREKSHNLWLFNSTVLIRAFPKKNSKWNKWWENYLREITGTDLNMKYDDELNRLINFKEK